METLLAFLIGILVAGAIYLMLSGNLLRFLFGLANEVRRAVPKLRPHVARVQAAEQEREHDTAEVHHADPLVVEREGPRFDRLPKRVARRIREVARALRVRDLPARILADRFEEIVFVALRDHSERLQAGGCRREVGWRR